MQRAPSARAASESYKQTACLRFSFPGPLSSLPLLPLYSAAPGLERGDVLRKQGQLSSHRIYGCLRNFSPRWNSGRG